MIEGRKKFIPIFQLCMTPYIKKGFSKFISNEYRGGLLNE